MECFEKIADTPSQMFCCVLITPLISDNYKLLFLNLYNDCVCAQSHQKHTREVLLATYLVSFLLSLIKSLPGEIW